MKIQRSTWQRTISKILLATLMLATALSGVGIHISDVQAAGYPKVVSIGYDGSWSNGSSSQETFPSISSDGRYIAFFSGASNIVLGDTNNRDDVFVYDQQTGTTERVSVASDGTQANEQSSRNSMSSDGRYVAFESVASNLVTGDTNNKSDAFMHDRQTGITERVSVASDGTQGNDGSNRPSLSADGRYVVFFSRASNLVPGDTNNTTDVFVHDRQTGTTERVSVASDGTEGNNFSENNTILSISTDGRYVVFFSRASNLVPGDTNNTTDVFVHDRQTGTTKRVSVASDGSQGNKISDHTSITPDGRYVVFASEASNLVPGDTNGTPTCACADVFLHDRQTSTTERVNVTSDGSQMERGYNASITPDGRYVVFDTSEIGDDNLEGNDIYVRDRQASTTELVNLAYNGSQANGYSLKPSISADGSYVAFASYATNLVPGDTNNTVDVFLTTYPFVPNNSPSVGAVTVSPNPVAVNTATTATASFTDPDTGDTHTASWNWGDGNTTAGTVTESNGSGLVSNNHAYTAAGVYTVTLTVTDGGIGATSTYQYVVVYDQSAGWASGSKEFTSPVGAVTGNSGATGTAKFGFQVKYQNGDIVPSGKNVELSFPAGNIDFASASYEWLVVNGTKATFKANGTLNGVPGYTMLVSAIDQGNGNPSGLVRFQIKDSSNNVVYDTQQGDADNADPTASVTKGKIAVH